VVSPSTSWQYLQVQIRLRRFGKLPSPRLHPPRWPACRTSSAGRFDRAAMCQSLRRRFSGADGHFLSRPADEVDFVPDADPISSREGLWTLLPCLCTLTPRGSPRDLSHRER